MDIEQLVLNWNKLGMDHLRFGNMKESLNLLTSAENALKDHQDPEKRSQLVGITYNNLGCYYKNKGDLTTALQYLYSAIQPESTSVEVKLNTASIHLNICAILSKLKRHDMALHNAQFALTMLNEIYKDNKRNESTLQSIIIAYHNIGNEYQHLRDKQSALESYLHGHRLALSLLGAKNTLTTTLAKEIRRVQIPNPRPPVQRVRRRRKYIFRNVYNNIKFENFPSIFDTNASTRQESSFGSSRGTPRDVEQAMQRRRSTGSAIPRSQRQSISRRNNSVNPDQAHRQIAKIIENNTVASLKNSIGEIQAKLLNIEASVSRPKPPAKQVPSRRLSIINEHYVANKSAQTIQKYWKGYKARRQRPQPKFSAKLLPNASPIKRRIDTKKPKQLPKIEQSTQAKKQKIDENPEEKAAAVKIQSAWKCYRVRFLYNRIYYAILHI